MQDNQQRLFFIFDAFYNFLMSLVSFYLVSIKQTKRWHWCPMSIKQYQQYRWIHPFQLPLQ